MSASLINEGLYDDEEPLSSINVTSLVDVMLCLLIMFMVTTPFMKSQGVAGVDLPPGRGEEVTEEDFLYSYVTIDKEGHVFLGSVALSDEPTQRDRELAGNIKTPDMVFLQIDENVEYGRVVDVLVALQSSKVMAVSFLTDPKRKRLEEARR